MEIRSFYFANILQNLPVILILKAKFLLLSLINLMASCHIPSIFWLPQSRQMNFFWDSFNPPNSFNFGGFMLFSPCSGVLFLLMSYCWTLVIIHILAYG